jgi:exodeoxyribonuclease VII large subunit
VRSELIAETAGLGRRLIGAMARGMEGRRTELRAAARALPDAERLLEAARQRLDSAGERLPNALIANASAHRTRLVRAAGRLAPGMLVLRLQRAHDQVKALSGRSVAALSRRADLRRQSFAALSDRLARSLGVYGQAQATRIARGRERLEALFARAPRALALFIRRRRDRLDGAAKLLGALSYQGVLARGFALVRDGAGRPVRAAAAVTPGMVLAIEFADGQVAATAGGAPPPRPIRAEPKPGRKPGEGQGSLF